MTVDPQATSKVRKTSSTAVFTKRHPTELPMTTWATATKKPGGAESVTPSMCTAPLNTTGPTRNGAGMRRGLATSAPPTAQAINSAQSSSGISIDEPGGSI